MCWAHAMLYVAELMHCWMLLNSGVYISAGLLSTGEAHEPPELKAVAQRTLALTSKA